MCIFSFVRYFHFAFFIPLFLHKNIWHETSDKKKVAWKKRDSFFACEHKMNHQISKRIVSYFSELFDLVTIISQNFIQSYPIAYILETTEQ